MELDSTFEQKNDIAKAVEDELEKVYLIVQVLLDDFIEGDCIIYLFCMCRLCQLMDMRLFRLSL